MRKQLTRTAMISLIALLVLTGCNLLGKESTQDWKVFAINEEPAIDIQFRLPPEWRVDYAPSMEQNGLWEVLLTPPKCKSDQVQDYADNCVNLTANIKGQSDFDKNDFIGFASQSITLNESGTEETLMMGQNSFEVNGITIRRFNHKLFIGEQDVQMSFLFFETEGAYYTFVIEMPYDERDGKMAAQFDLLVSSLKVID